MSRLETALQNDLKLLRLLRDELELHAHLLKADLKDSWDTLERRWEKLEADVGRAEIAAADAGREVNASLGELMHSLRSGYTQIKQALGR